MRVFRADMAKAQKQKRAAERVLGPLDAILSSVFQRALKAQFPGVYNDTVP